MDWRDRFFTENPMVLNAYEEKHQSEPTIPLDKFWCEDCGGDQGVMYTQGENTVCESCMTERVEEGDRHGWRAKE